MIETRVAHRCVDIDGLSVFYRECGPKDAPVLLLPHGYPCSSYQYRRLMAALGDRWRTLAPDYPGFGYSDTPEDFAYTFDGYTQFLERFCETLGVTRYSLYLHDYGSSIGFRLCIARPDAIERLIIQNGDIYEDALGPKYEVIQAFWRRRAEDTRAPLRAAVSEAGFKHEFVGEVDEAVAATVPPDLWKLHWPLMDTPKRRDIALKLMENLDENVDWYPRYQRYLREHQPPTLIVWGPEDGYMPEPAARAHLRDLPAADLHIVAGAGHWLLETHFDEALPLIRGFLSDQAMT